MSFLLRRRVLTPASFTYYLEVSEFGTFNVMGETQAFTVSSYRVNDMTGDREDVDYTISLSGAGFSRSEYTITATENQSLNERTGTLVVTQSHEDGKSVSKTFKQDKGYYTYSDVTISGGSVDVIPASGGTVSTVSGYTYSQTYGWNGRTSGVGTVTSGGKVHYSDVVTASALEEIKTSQTNVGTLTIGIDLNGKTGGKSYTVYQAVNKVTKTELLRTVYLGNTTLNVGASGGDAYAEGYDKIVSGRVYLESGARIDITLSDYGTLTGPTYSWASDSDWATLTSANVVSINVKVSSRGTIYDANSRTATVTRTTAISYDMDEVYRASEYVCNDIVDTDKFNIIQAKNVITSAELEINQGENLMEVSQVGAAGGIVTLSVNDTRKSGIYAHLTFSSGSSIMDGEYGFSYGSVGNKVYSWSEEDPNNMLSWNNTNTMSIDVTVASRGTEYSASTRKATIFRTLSATYTLSDEYNDGFTSISAISSADYVDITQAANTITLGEVSVSAGILDSTNYPAAGGTKTIEAEYPITASIGFEFSSGSGITETYGTSSDYGQFSINYGWSSDQSYATLTSANTPTIDVTMPSRGTTIGNERSATITRTVTVTYKLNNTYGGASKTSEAYSATTTVTQEGNLITSVRVNSNTLSYSQSLAASATSASPTTTQSPIYEFTSGSTSLTTPGSAYGSLASTVTYTLDTSQNGFTAVNSTSGVLTATNRGTTIGNTRTSGNVTKSVSYKWTHTSTYGSNAATGSASTVSASCTQVGNYVTSIAATTSSSNYATHTYYPQVTAAAQTVSPGLNGAAILTFTSGSTISSIGTHTGLTGITFARTYKLNTSATGASLDTSTGIVTWAANTSTSSSRTLKVDVTLTVTATHNSTYSAGGTVSNSLTQVTSSIQSADATTTITYGTPTISSFTVNDISAAGGTISSGTVAYSQSRTQNYVSGNTTSLSAVTSGATVNYGTAVTAASLGTTIKNKSSVGTLATTVTLNWKSSTKSATVYQLGNYVKTLTLSGGALEYDTFSAAGQSLTPSTSTNKTVTYTFTSGSATTAAPNITYGLFNRNISYGMTTATGFTLGSTATGSITASNNQSTTSRSTTAYRYETDTWTPTSAYNSGGTITSSQGSNSCVISQAAGYYSYSTPSVTLSYGTAAAAGASVTPTFSVSQTYGWNGVTSGVGTITTAASKTFGITTAVTGASINSTSGVVTWTNNMSTSSRSVTTIKVSGTMSTSGTTFSKTGVTCAQSAGAKVYNTPTVTAYSYADFAASGGTKSPTVTYSQVWTWNGVSGSGGTLNSGGTLTYGHTSNVSGCARNGGNITWSNNTSTSTRNAASVLYVNVAMNGKTSPNFTCTSCKQAAGAKQYGAVSITSFSYGDKTAASGTVAPTFAYSQPWTWNGVSGSGGTLTSGGASTFSGSATGATVNTSSGVVTWTANKGTTGTMDAQARTVTVTAKVGMNGATSSASTTTSKQLGEAISSTGYGAWTFNVTPSASTISATGGSVTISISRPTRSVTHTLSSEDTVNTSENATAGSFALSRSNTSFSMSTTSLSFTANTSFPITMTVSVSGTGATTASAISTTLTAAFTATSPTGGTTTASKTSSSITRNKSELTNTAYRFGTFSLGSTSGDASPKSVTLSMVVQRQYTYTGGTGSWTTITPSSGDLTVTSTTGGTVGTISPGATSTVPISISGNTASSARTITLTGKYKSTLATSTATYSQSADAVKSTTYANPVVTFNNYGTKDASSGTVSPTTPTYSQIITYAWNSGKANTTASATTGGSISYSGSATGASVNTSTGVVTWAANTSTASTRSVTVTATVTLHGKSGSDTATSTQQKDEPKTYGNVTFTTALSYPNVGPSTASMTASPTKAASQTVTMVSGSTRAGSISYSYAATTASSYASVNTSTGVVTWNANPLVTSDRTVGITCTATGEGSKKATSTATSKCVKDTYTYGTLYSRDFNIDSVPASGGTVTPIISSWGQIRNWSTGSTDYPTVTPSITYAQAQNFLNDPGFMLGWNSISTYSNSTSSDGCTVKITRISASQAPVNCPSDYCMKINSVGVGPKRGGFHVARTGVEGETYLTTFTYSLPLGYEIMYGTSSIGTGGVIYLYGDRTGDGYGVWRQFTQFTKFGTNPSNTFFFYVNGPTGSDTTSVDLYVTNLQTCKVSNVTPSGATLNTSTGAITLPSLGITETTLGVRTYGAGYLIAVANGVVTHLVYSPWQQANTATYGAVTVTSNGSASDIPASGGTITASGGAGTQTVSYTSGSTRAGSVTCGTYSSVSASSLGTTITNRASKGNSTATLTGEGGKTATVSVAVYQAANRVTAVAPNTNTLSYSNIAAGATSASPTSSHTPKFTFTSGSTSATTPSSTYGSLASTVTYSIANKTTNGFTNINTASGVLTATSRGTTYGASARASAVITKTVTYKWTHSSAYGGAAVTGSSSSTATCSQNANIITNLEMVSSSGGALTNPAEYAAGGATKAVANKTAASCGIKLTFSSGSTTTNYSTYATLTGPTYSWKSNQTYATLTSANTASLNVTMPSRGATTGSARSATITRTASFTGALKSGYTSAGSKSASANATATVTQGANNQSSSVYSWGTPSVTIGSGITAGGGSATISASVTDIWKYTYTSGYTGGSTFTKAGSTSSPTISTQTASRYSISGNTLSHSSMNSTTGTDSCTVSVKNAGSGGNAGTKSVSVTNTQSSTLQSYGTPTVSITNSNLSAAGGTAKVTASVNNIYKYTYTSGYTGGSTFTQVGSIGSISIKSSTASSRWSYSSNKLTHSSMGTSTGTDKCIMQATNAGSTSKVGTADTGNITNSMSTSVYSYGTPSKPTISNSNISAAGGTAKISGSTVSNTIKRTYTSGSTNTYTTAGNVAYKEVYDNGNRYAIANGTIGTATTGTITHSSMGASTGTDTIGVAAYNYNDTSKVSSSASTSATNSKATCYTYSNPTGSLTYSNVSASGGTSTPTINFSQPYTTYYKYTSGSTSAGSSGTNTTSYTKGSFARTSGVGTVNTTSGAISYGSNPNFSTRSTGASVTLTGSGSKSCTATGSCTQNAASSIPLAPLGSLLLLDSGDWYGVGSTSVLVNFELVVTATDTGRSESIAYTGEVPSGAGDYQLSTNTEFESAQLYALSNTPTGYNYTISLSSLEFTAYNAQQSYYIEHINVTIGNHEHTITLNQWWSNDYIYIDDIVTNTMDLLDRLTFEDLVDALSNNLIIQPLVYG